MKSAPLLSLSVITKLVTHQVITDQYPWVSGNTRAVEAHHRAICATITRSTGALSRVEWNHYGSGYASFVDAWFYKKEPSFDPGKALGYQEEHTGLVVLLSRLSPYFVFMEGEKRWDEGRASSYLPDFDMVDRFSSQAVTNLSEEVQSILESFGMVRASRGELEEPLPSGMKVATILTDRGYTQFDALFHWED